MQIIRSFNTQHLPLLTCAVITFTLGLLFTWRPLFGGLAVGLAVLVHLARISGPSAPHGLVAGHDPTVSSWDDDLFTEPSPSSPSIETIETVNVLRPNDLHVFGDGLLGGGGWDDNFDFSSSCCGWSGDPSFD